MRAAVLGGLAGAMLAAIATAAVLLSKTRLWTSSSTAPVGILFVVPALAAMSAVPGSILGASLGYLASGWSHGRRLCERGMAIAGLLVLAVAGWALWETVPELLRGRKVRAVEQMSEPELGQVLDNRIYGRDAFVLAAVAGNPRASGDTLDRITLRTEPELHERNGTLFDDVQGKNTRGTAVMRLVAQNPNVRPESVERLASSSHPYTVAFVASNPKLSEATVGRLAASFDPNVLHGVAWNPKTPPEFLERFSRSDDRNIRLAVVGNRSTPAEIVPRLWNDPDDLVRQQALRTVRPPEDPPTPFLPR
ncbi:MAG TPA: hypothetical protein VFD38_10765 [Myxococcaceae bacterium]|nr:hypothetical protein [Myxococcaceae bacterium]